VRTHRKSIRIRIHGYESKKEATSALTNEEKERLEAVRQEEKGYYYAHKVVGRNDPNGDQVKRYPGIEDDNTLTKKKRLFLRVDWGPDHEGQDSFEPFTELATNIFV
jgi:hypothetical protein